MEEGRNFLKVLYAMLRHKIQRFRKQRNIRKFFIADYKRYAAHSGSMDQKESLFAYMTLLAHSLEKGICMPAPRSGFGVTKLEALLPLCRKAITQYGKSEPQLKDIIFVLFEYRKYQQILHGELPEKLVTELDAILAQFPEPQLIQLQIETTGEKLFAHRESSFPEFAADRHSVRNFAPGVIPAETLMEVIGLAGALSPSACNRQSPRVCIIQDPMEITRLLTLHGSGTNGFREKVQNLLLVCGLLDVYQGGRERNCAYVDGGLFTMNLVYALHYRKIGSCILNCSLTPEVEQAFRQSLKLPGNYIPIALVACGTVAEHLRVCRSARKPADELIIQRR